MFSIKIPKGAISSASVTLGHKQISCIYLPRTEQPVTILFTASSDGKEFGPIYHVRRDAEPLTVTTQSHMSIRTFDPNDFEGIMYIKLVLGSVATEDFEFPMYLKEY